MSLTKKLIIAVVALSLVLVGVISGTLAYLVAESNTVTNTFTYGKIEITLAETKGTQDSTDSTKRNFANIVPGDVIDKDPVVTVAKGSEKCYVYVLIENQLGTAATYNIATNNWIKVGESSTKVLYRYNTVVDARSADQQLTVFTKLTFVTTLDKDGLTSLANKNVVISAYAHQSENTTETTATAAAIDWAGVTAVSTEG